MPIGLSLVAPRYRDQHLLKVSKIVGDALISDGVCNEEKKDFFYIAHGGGLAALSIGAS